MKYQLLFLYNLNAFQLAQSNVNGTYTYKQKRCVISEEECEHHRCCDVTSCEHIAEGNYR